MRLDIHQRRAPEKRPTKHTIESSRAEQVRAQTVLKAKSSNSDSFDLQTSGNSNINWKNAFFKQGSTNYWVSTYPMFSSTLYLSNVNSVIASENQSEVKNIKVNLTFFDPDGAIFNSAEVEVPSTEITAINLVPFMGSAKLQAGIKHARLEVSGNAEILSCLRLYAKETQEVLEPMRFISKVKPDFFKLLFAVDRLSFLAIVNPAPVENTVKLKVFSAMEGLEVKLVVPPRGARVYEVASLFPKIISKREERSFPAYIRLITRAEESLGVQCYQQRLITVLT